VHSEYVDSDWREKTVGCAVPGMTLVAPTKISVPAIDTAGSYDVSWEPPISSVSIDVTYVLEEATDSTFATNKRIAYVGNATSAPIEARAKGFSYFYRVKTLSPGYKDSLWRVGSNACKVPAVSATGLWIGTVTDKYGFAFNVYAVISAENQVRVISSDGVMYAANLQLTGNKASGTLKGYAPEGYLFYNGKSITTGTLSLTVSEQDFIRGTYTAEGGDNGSIVLQYNPYLEMPVTLDNLVGVWESYGLGIRINVNEYGSFAGIDYNGCKYTGNITQKDRSWDIYNVTVTATQCGAYNGTYAGLAYYDKDTYNEYMQLLVSNSLYAVLDTFMR